MPDSQLDESLRALRAPSRADQGDGDSHRLPAILAAADRRRRHDRVLRAGSGVVVAVLVVAVLAAIPRLRSDDVRVETPPDRRPGIAFAADGSATPDQLERTAEIVRRRLAAAGLADAAVTVENGGIVVRGTGPGDAELLDQVVQPSVLTFRPVIRDLPPGTATTPAAEDRPEATIRLPNSAPAGHEPEVLELGPALDGSIIESARAELGITARWTVNPVFRPGADGIDRFNALAGALFAMTSAPMGHGRMAIIVNGQVLSAPTINSPAFERDRIEISGGFTEQSAKDLADLLSLGPLPVALTAR
jgi:preprotein translocase subunit SecD